jgi:hypothetical protein
VAIVIRGHEYPFELHEMTETIPFTDEDIEKWRAKSWSGRERQGMPPPQHKRKRVLGRLALHMPNGYQGGRAKWTEGPRGPLEGKLASVFEVLEERAKADDIAAAERARAQQERERIANEQRELARVRQIEDTRAKRLLAEAAAWDRSTQIRSYVEALNRRLPELDPPERQRLASWCEWAADWADRGDPVLHTELIAGVDAPEPPPYAR